MRALQIGGPTSFLLFLRRDYVVGVTCELWLRWRSSSRLIGDASAAFGYGSAAPTVSAISPNSGPLLP